MQCNELHPVAEYDDGCPLVCTLPSGHGGMHEDASGHDDDGTTPVWSK